MKKLFLAAFVASMFVFASCGNPIDKKLDRLEEIKEQIMKLDEEGANKEEYADFIPELKEIKKDLEEMEKDMTEEQKERLNGIINN